MFKKQTQQCDVMRVIKLTWLSIMLYSLSGCITAISTVNCIDTMIGRDPIERNFIVSIENIQTRENETRKVTCEGTYSAQCSVRGNSWHWNQKESEPYKIVLGSNEVVYMRLPFCSDLANDNVNKKSNKIFLTDGRHLTLKYVWAKTDDWLWPQGYKPFYDPRNQYIYYMNDDKNKKRRKVKPYPNTEEGKRVHYMEVNQENDRKPSYVVPLNFSYKEL